MLIPFYICAAFRIYDICGICFAGDPRLPAFAHRTCPPTAGDANATNHSPSNQTLAISPQSDARHKPLRPSCV
ncbi:hypothetical protein BLIG_02186 [Bifidobacterium longum subsp. infantis CCUG 52486]|uniref:Uncharacterized protein n=1 Tax=Bifidobacterium longum subsp. infantis CCUG 52486 TaxID=537937 RepID=C5EDG3_BIFLI|nr:hypothetical protein BLIG_02186 [Bifidobacterium longum subsp. infantis CCUG 52486]